MNDPIPSIEERPLLEVGYSNRRVLPSLVNRGADCVELFVPAQPPLEEGARLRLRVSFGDSGRNFYIGGRAAPTRPGSDRRGGFFLVIQAPEDRRAFKHLWSFCTGLYQEQARRFPTSIKCSVRTPATTLRGRILDVSMSGVFVAVDEPSELMPGASVQVRVPTGFLHLLRRDVAAHLVWQGQKSGNPGFGAEFVDRARAGLQLIRQGVHRAR